MTATSTTRSLCTQNRSITSSIHAEEYYLACRLIYSLVVYLQCSVQSVLGDVMILDHDVHLAVATKPGSLRPRAEWGRHVQLRRWSARHGPSSTQSRSSQTLSTTCPGGKDDGDVPPRTTRDSCLGNAVFDGGKDQRLRSIGRRIGGPSLYSQQQGPVVCGPRWPLSRPVSPVSR